LTKALSVTPAEKFAFQKLLADGVDISVQMVPNDERIDLKEVI
jgi:PTS system mannose-specific IIB component